eukprot:IDg14886t1
MCSQLFRSSRSLARLHYCTSALVTYWRPLLDDGIENLFSLIEFLYREARDDFHPNGLIAHSRQAPHLILNRLELHFAHIGRLHFARTYSIPSENKNRTGLGTTDRAAEPTMKNSSPVIAVDATGVEYRA